MDTARTALPNKLISRVILLTVTLVSFSTTISRVQCYSLAGVMDSGGGGVDNGGGKASGKQPLTYADTNTTDGFNIATFGPPGMAASNSGRLVLVVIFFHSFRGTFRNKTEN